MLYLFIKIVVCFFAVVGMMYTTLYVSDLYTSKRSGMQAVIVIKKIDDINNAEYAIRILEGQLCHSPVGHCIYAVVPDFPGVTAELTERLNAEYGNLKKEV